MAEKSVGPPPPPGGVFEIVLLDVKPSELGTAADYSAEYLNAVTPENAHVSVAHVEAIEDAEAKAAEAVTAEPITSEAAARAVKKSSSFRNYVAMVAAEAGHGHGGGGGNPHAEKPSHGIGGWVTAAKGLTTR